MKQFFSPQEILSAQSPDLPSSLRSIQRLANDLGWQRQDGKAQKRGGRAGEWEYHVSLLPQTAQVKLGLLFSSPANDDRNEKQDMRKRLWERYEALPAEHKQVAKGRLDALDAVSKLSAAGGMSESAALSQICVERGFSKASFWNWRKLTSTHDRADWLAALAPQWAGKSEFAECHPDAWQVLLDDYLRLSQPALTACYRRMLRLAKKNGWSPIPSERALRRRIEAEVPIATRTIARAGREKARQIAPAQRRTVKDLHAMAAVNMDGHKLDVFVNWPGLNKPVRPILVAIQDIYSRKMVAWRLSDSENRETVRLAIGDMVETWGIPAKWTLDNGRAFASKWITGGIKNRFRFKVKEEDPQGLLLALGIEVHWAKPGRGQSKPIERSFGDMIAEAVSRHPLCDGAYTGNTPLAKPENYATRAVSHETIVALVNQEIHEHNARQGRRTEMAAGRSFDDAFAESYAQSSIPMPTEAQKSLWLLAAERIRAQKGSGVIHFMGNRYYDSALSALAGKDVTIRFDPEKLHQAVRVYDAKDRFICAAPIFDDTGFYSRGDARLRAKDEKALLRTASEQARLIRKMDAETLGRLYLSNGFVDENPAPKPKVRRLATGSSRAVALPEPVQFQEPDFDVEAAYATGLKLIYGGRDD